MSSCCIGGWNIKRNEYITPDNSSTEMHCDVIHSLSPIPVRSDTFMSIGIDRTEHKRIGHLFVLIRCANSELVPMPSEVNVSFHYA